MLYWNSCWTVNASFRKIFGVVSRFLQCSVVQTCFFSQRSCLRSSYCDCSCIGWLLSLHYSFVFFIFWFGKAFSMPWYGLLAQPGLCPGVLAGLREADPPVHDNHAGDPWTGFQKPRVSAWYSSSIHQQQLPWGQNRADLYWGPFWSRFLSRSWSSSSMTCTPRVSIHADSDTPDCLLL